MRHFNELIGDLVRAAFIECGFNEKYGSVSISNRPDLCEFQCNGAMAAAKEYGRAPFMIADEVVAKLENRPEFEKVESVKPGFINIIVSPDFIADYIKKMLKSDKFGYTGEEEPKRVVIDFGGANVAKPLHVGHLRSAVIGESIKRINKYAGNTVFGDVHLGDWGLQMGLIIEQLHDDQPSLPYFDENFRGEYPKEAPFTLSELEEIYPRASGRSKEDEDFLKRAQLATLKLQKGYTPYREIWNHIMRLSKADLKKNYDALDVSFDIWKGESDAQPFIPDMIEDLKNRGIAHESQRALVVDVTQEGDSKEIPPCIVQKSDGAALYATSDLATIIDRKKTLNPDEYIYVADKRQELHFTQVFRAARKAGFIGEEKTCFLGFGTMNGKDGKPFKTRAGGVMRLESLIEDINSAVYNRIEASNELSKELAGEVSKMIAISAIKYGDLSNQASRDYIFDIERFTSFEGNTGPYILYTVVRIKSILDKQADLDSGLKYGADTITKAYSDKEKKLYLKLSEFSQVMKNSYEDLAPHRICQFMYEVSDICNGFYHDTKILSEEDEAKKKSWLALIELTKDVLLQCLDLLAIKCPERM